MVTGVADVSWLAPSFPGLDQGEPAALRRLLLIVEDPPGQQAPRSQRYAQGRHDSTLSKCQAFVPRNKVLIVEG